MTEKEFQEFLNACCNETQDKQKKLIAEYNLKDYTKYIFHQTDKSLEFKNEVGQTLIFDIACIGSWDYKEKVWVWAWANDNLSEAIREESIQLKALADQTGYQIFEKEGFDCEEIVARDLAYIGVHALNGIGVYRITAEDNYLFLVLKQVKYKK
ncbi:MAG: hypothetical protein IJ086_07705 [Clostridium sp.]|nr:hypothetical protein [Clostridium sp.]